MENIQFNDLENQFVKTNSGRVKLNNNKLIIISNE